MDKIVRALNVLKTSWQVLKKDKELLMFPVASFILTALVAVTIGGIGWWAGVVDEAKQSEGRTTSGYLMMGTFYFLSYFIGIFFNAAIVGAATIRLKGGDPKAGDGLAIARSHVGKIAGWALLSSTVGIILQLIKEHGKFVADFVASLTGAAWNAITFFVVPVILYEDLGTIDSVKRSGQLFKERWGEQFTGQVSIAVAVFLVSLPFYLVVLALGWAGFGLLAIALGLVGISVIVAVSSALKGIFTAALYQYATTGEAVSEFSSNQLEAVFAPK